MHSHTYTWVCACRYTHTHICMHIKHMHRHIHKIQPIKFLVYSPMCKSSLSALCTISALSSCAFSITSQDGSVPCGSQRNHSGCAAPWHLTMVCLGVNGTLSKVNNTSCHPHCRLLIEFCLEGSPISTCCNSAWRSINIWAHFFFYENEFINYSKDVKFSSIFTIYIFVRMGGWTINRK